MAHKKENIQILNPYKSKQCCETYRDALPFQTGLLHNHLSVCLHSLTLKDFKELLHLSISNEDDIAG